MTANARVYVDPGLRRKATKAQVIERVSVVFKLLLKGTSRAAIVQYAATNWGLGIRQADNLIAKARQEIQTANEPEREYELGLALLRLDELYRQAYQQGAWMVCLRICDQRCSLLGLWPEQRKYWGEKEKEPQENPYAHLNKAEARECLAEFEALHAKWAAPTAKRGASQAMEAYASISPSPIAKRGAPTVLTPHVQNNIVTAIKSGATIEGAVAYAGISQRSYYHWIKKGASPKAPDLYRDFLQATQQALAHAEILFLSRIAEASKTNWRASAWILSHRFKERWGNHVVVETTSPASRESRLEASEPTNLKS